MAMLRAVLWLRIADGSGAPPSMRRSTRSASATSATSIRRSSTPRTPSQYWDPIDGLQCKNLFLRNKKGDRHYLVVLEISKRADLKDLVKLVGDDRLSFGSPERLMAQLGLTPGSVSPFGLINDADGSVRVLVDVDLKGASAADLSSQHQHRERGRVVGGPGAVSGDAAERGAGHQPAEVVMMRLRVVAARLAREGVAGRTRDHEMGVVTRQPRERTAATGYMPEQSALKPQRRQRMQPLILASCRVSPQFSQKSMGTALGGGAAGSRVGAGGMDGAGLGVP